MDRRLDRKSKRGLNEGWDEKRHTAAQRAKLVLPVNLYTPARVANRAATLHSFTRFYLLNIQRKFIFL